MKSNLYNKVKLKKIVTIAINISRVAGLKMQNTSSRLVSLQKLKIFLKKTSRHIFVKITAKS